jgi:hypothetical protein
MPNNRVRVNSKYIYHANLLDRCDGRTDLQDGDIVKVVNRYGCPKANTMGHCYVEYDRGDEAGLQLGLVHCNSLHTPAEYAAAKKDGRI